MSTSRKSLRAAGLHDFALASELGDAEFLGVYEHFYTDNFSGTDFSTHYVVLGYRLVHDLDLNSLPDAQHHSYRWFDVAELLASVQVHDNTKAYFLSDK